MNTETRVKGILRRKICYGSCSEVRDMENSDDKINTHKWTVYLRGISEDEDLSFIKSVTIQIHESFPNPNRIFYAPPFEVTECGWGEFEIGFVIEFVDPLEKKLDVKKK
jgi:YEATS domain-containing protein 4